MSKFSRYGKFPVIHPMHITDIIMVLMCIGIFDYAKVGWYIFVAIYLFFLYRQVSPFFEHYSIDKNTIYISSIKYKAEKEIPNDSVFIISYTDLGGYYYSFKNRFMVNIVTGDLDYIHSILHSDKCKTVCKPSRYGYGLCLREEKILYNNLYIENQFKNSWIYSFAYNKDFADEFFYEQKKPVIIPRSLVDKIQIEPNGFEIIIDEER